MTSSPNPIQAELLHALRTRVIPWAQEDGIKRLALIKPPLQVPPQIQIANQPLPVLRETGRNRSHSYLQRWPNEGLDSMRVPYLGCVLEGEADLRMGITQRMMAETEGLDKRYGCQVLTLPQQTFFFIPPGVPHSDGTRPHWERPHSKMAYSRILWLHFLSTGAFCHVCVTQGITHTSCPLFFVADAQLAALADLLMEEMQTRPPRFEPVAQANLLLLLLRVERGLATKQAPRVLHYPDLPSSGTDLSSQATDLSPTGVAAFKRACDYIRTHLDDTLTISLIAEHAYVSPSYLKRIFQSRLGTTVMKFVTQCRMESARSLLRDTDLPIGHVALHMGYVHHAHFGQVFLRQVGMTPGEYRNRHRANQD